MSGDFVRHVRTSSAQAHQYVEVNNPARRGYRTAALVVGLLLAALGAVALAVASDVPFAGRAGHAWLGLSLNRSGGVLLLVLGLLAAAAALAPGNGAAAALTGVGSLSLVAGLVALAVQRTAANVVAFSVLDICLLWLFALALLWCGMHTWESASEHGRTLFGGHPAEYQDEHREPSR